jgi:hypothetical protein
MRDARALLASIGTSALVISAAAASLLSISFVFAIGGFDGDASAGSAQALVLNEPSHAESGGGTDAARTVPVVVAPRAPAQRSERSAASSARVARAGSGKATKISSSATGDQNTSQLSSGGPTAGDPSTSSAPQPSAKPNLGDNVKQLGNDLSTKVQETGSSLAQATAPLGPPVSAAVQQVLNVVATLLQQTTNLLGNALGAQPGK